MANLPKRRAAQAAADGVTAGMRLGLGSGSTALLFVEALGRRVADGLILPPAAATSRETAAAARAAGIALLDLEATDEPLVPGAGPRLDLAVDGADEIDPVLRLIKGGGGCLTREKIVAAMAERIVIVADATKEVGTLGAFPLPVEVVPFGWRATAAALAASLGVTPRLRMAGTTPLVTDNGNLVLDCPLGAIADPEAVAAALDATTGVVEHGLFIGLAHEALIGAADGVRRVAPQAAA